MQVWRGGVQVAETGIVTSPSVSIDSPSSCVRTTRSPGARFALPTISLQRDGDDLGWGKANVIELAVSAVRRDAPKRARMRSKLVARRALQVAEHDAARFP